jgi:hypothetical protein
VTMYVFPGRWGHEGEEIGGDADDFAILPM